MPWCVNNGEMILPGQAGGLEGQIVSHGTAPHDATRTRTTLIQVLIFEGETNLGNGAKGGRGRRPRCPLCVFLLTTESDVGVCCVYKPPILSEEETIGCEVL